MKVQKFSLILAVFVLVNSQSNEKVDLTVLKAITGVMTSYFAPHEPKVDVIFSGPKSEDLAEKILQEKPMEVSVRVIKLDDIQRIEPAPSIVLFDSGEHYQRSVFQTSPTNMEGDWPTRLIYVPKTGKADILEIWSEAKFGFENENFISIVNTTTVDLVTGFRFSPGECNSIQYRAINQFSTNNMKWQNENFFPEKYENFHGCPLTLGYTSESSTHTSQEIYMSLGVSLNFELRAEQVASEEELSRFDITELLVYQSLAYLNALSEFSSALYSDYLTFSVPAGEPYTQLEKMFLTFDKATWICIGVTLGVALLVIQVINFMSLRLRNFVFGREVQTPTLNIASIFLNGGQHRVPGRNFARFLLMLFVIWSLIIRTCYQSELYKNLQEDLRKPRIQTIDELNEQNLTLLYLSGYEHTFAEMGVDRQVKPLKKASL
jgi:hypothetical protein